MNRSIDERAEEYINSIYGEDSYGGDEIYSAFYDGAESEYKELTKWNDPNDSPEIDKLIVIRFTKVDDKSNIYLVSKYTENLFSFSKQIGATITGWRYFYE